MWYFCLFKTKNGNIASNIASKSNKYPNETLCCKVHQGVWIVNWISCWVPGGRKFKHNKKINLNISCSEAIMIIFLSHYPQFFKQSFLSPFWQNLWKVTNVIFWVVGIIYQNNIFCMATLNKQNIIPQFSQFVLEQLHIDSIGCLHGPKNKLIFQIILIKDKYQV